ncbi:MAG: PSD1 domain-containing protein [Verrucomicrobiaceae bacterium]|nr:PSD1 domain-containing protein [Verrucomicrobiaceae bacterium]
MKPQLPILLLSLSVVSAARAVDFSREVLPILQRACFECHGHEVQKAGLRFDHKAAAFKGSEHGAVISPGKPEASELLRRVTLPRTDKESMPRRGKALAAAEIETLREWIATGAVWPDDVKADRHWAYVPPVKAAVPMSANDTWSRNEIDRFVMDRLQRENLSPSPAAEATVLYRRLSFDLTGLPPSPAAVEVFAKAMQSDPEAAIQKAADDLLKSPEFGVKWARHWLDLARYADSHGYQRDDLRDVWAFRDWVVNALNADMPFDRFTIDQVAGDLLPNATQDQFIATGFHRCTPTNVEAGTEPEESRINQVIDRVNTTGAVWLGTTMECAQCHNHKYDPFSQQDYYGLLAFFNNTEQEADRTNPSVPGSIQFKGPSMTLADDAKANPETEALTKAIADLDARMAEMAKDAEASFAKWATRMSSEINQAAEEHPLEIVEFVSDEGSAFEILPDHSVLLKGASAPTDTYHIVARANLKGVTAIKLEALTDPSLPGQGPGRGEATRPNFVLNTFSAASRQSAANDDAGKPWSFVGATADFAQKNFDPAGAIDTDTATAWAINPEFHKPHWAVFELEAPQNIDASQELVFTLAQTYGGARTLGRVRISAVTGSLAAGSLPEAAAKVLRKPEARRKPREIAILRRHFDQAMPGLAALKRERAGLEKELAGGGTATTTLVMKELSQPRMSAIFKRGDYTQPGDRVQAHTPSILPASEGPPNRVTLARWLVSRQNPLTARVTVNRLWAEIFGHGIVTTLEDFGIKGERPTHPELLDWLAVDFMDQGWSIKTLLRKIVTSATYRQRSDTTPEMLARDDQNLLYARGPRFRLDAEAIRDNALTISGLISLGKGGPPIRPPQPDGLWKKVGGQQYDYQVSPGEQQYRRGLYVVLKRGAPYPSFVTFDASARMACVIKRSRSNTPLQALTLLNDPVYVEAGHALAARMAKESPSSAADERIRYGFRLATAREPRAEELQVLMRLYEAQISQGEETALQSIATALLNLDETITKE